MLGRHVEMTNLKKVYFQCKRTQTTFEAHLHYKVKGISMELQVPFANMAAGSFITMSRQMILLAPCIITVCKYILDVKPQLASMSTVQTSIAEVAVLANSD